MNTLDLLKQKLSQLTRDLNTLVQENRQLKSKIEHLQNQNDILTRKSQDLLLSINNRLKNEEENN